MSLITMKMARIGAGMTQQEVADAMGIHVQTYARLEKNPEDISIRDSKRFAEIVARPWADISFVCDSNLIRV